MSSKGLIALQVGHFASRYASPPWSLFPNAIDPSMCAYHFRNTQALSLRWAKVFRQPPISHHLKGPLNPVGLIFAVMPIFKVWVALVMPARGLNNLICPVSINFGRIINAIYLILLPHIFLNVRWDLRRPLFQAIV